MNILYHHRTRGSGAEGTHVKAIVDELRNQGHTVEILAFPGVDSEKENASAAPTIPLPIKWHIRVLLWLAGLTKNSPIVVFELFEILYNLLIPYRFCAAINTHKPAFVYERYSLFMFASVWIAKRKSIPIILEVNDSALVIRIRPIVLVKLAKLIEKWVFRQCTGIVFVSTYLQNLAVTEYESIANSVICPNAAELSKFDLNKYDKVRAKDAIGLKEKIVCGYTGGFGKWHGIEWFVEKIIPFFQSNPTYALLLVGDGATFEGVKARVNDAGMSNQIVLTGRVKHDDIPQYIAAMDFGVLPDLNAYCSPMKLFESMAMAQGMVLPGSDPVKEVVIDGQTSWLFPVNDHQACIDKVMQVFADTAQQTRVGLTARAYIERERQWSDNVALIYSLLDQDSMGKT